MKAITILLGVVLIATMGASQADAGLIIDLMGDQDFADGQSPILANDLPDTIAGDPPPFNLIFGSDPSGVLGSVSYTHDFSLAGGLAISASIMLGIVDHDSFLATEDTIDIFFDGIQQTDSMWRGISTNPSSASVRTMSVDPSLLLDGLLTVNVVAVLPAAGFRGNAIAMDFSKLTIETQSTGMVPEPTSMMLLGIGLAGLVGYRRRSTKKS